jgi:hypothetical protein
MAKDKLDIYAFGRELVTSKDLDPVYVLLWEAKFPPSKLRHWLISYFCFYHVGTASWIVDQEDYWKAMFQAAESKDYPRSSERRHFRAKNAMESVAYLKRTGIAQLFQPFYGKLSVGVVQECVQRWIGFGPWIGFKVADMLDSLGICEVEFNAASAMYKGSPTEATAILKDWEQPEWEPNSQDELSEWAVDRVLSNLEGLQAPPRYDRELSFQEAETILCKWKSYLGGHYELGEDIKACRKGLLRFAKCRTSQQLLKAGKAGGLW